MPQLYKKYYDLIEVFLNGVSQNDIDDLAQELRIKLIEVCEKIESRKIVPNNFDDYIFTCLNYCKKRFFKKNKSKLVIMRCSDYEELDKINLTFFLGYENSEEELIEKIWRVAEFILTKHELDYLIMHYRDGIKNIIIAQKFGVTPQSVSKIIRIAVKKIKKSIEKIL